MILGVIQNIIRFNSMYGLIQKSIIPGKYAWPMHNPTCTLKKTARDYISTCADSIFTYKYRQLRQV
jgi:hypothetical protein